MGGHFHRHFGTQIAGDAIFIPNAWWHAVEALGGPAVSISARGVTFCEGIAFLMLGLMGGWRILDDFGFLEV